MSIREPGRPMPAARYDVPGGGAPRGRRSWRVLLIGLAAILTWVLMNALLTQLPWLQAGDMPAPQTTPRPAPSDDSVPRPPVRQPEAADDHVFWFLAVSTAALMVLILTAAVVVRIRRRRSAVPVSAVAPTPDADAAVVEPASGSESLALAAERGLAEVGDLSREPREAIIACYAAMETRTGERAGRGPAGLRHPLGGAGARGGTPGAAVRQRDRTGHAVRRGPLQHARDERGPSRGRRARAAARFSTNCGARCDQAVGRRARPGHRSRGTRTGPGRARRWVAAGRRRRGGPGADRRCG